jgi:hypothetical protein
MRLHKFPLFFSPDAGADIGSGDISVPVVPSPTPAPNVTEVDLGSTPGVEAAGAVKELEKSRTVRGPSDFGMESAEESSERAGLTTRPRDENGKFIKAGNASPSTQRQPRAKATTPPAANKPTPTAQPAKQPAVVATPEPAAPTAKVKIGDQEKTPEEWAAHFKELEAKANPKAPEVKQPEPPAKTEAETAAEQQAREEAFLKTAREGKTWITQEAIDKAIANGDPEFFKDFAARVEMSARQFAADQVNQLAEHYDKILSPLLTHNQSVQSLMQEAAFLGAHPDIKSHPEGAKTFREMKSTMESGRRAIAEKIAAGTASRREQLWAEEYDETPQEKLMDDLAAHTRAKLGTTATPTATPTPAPAKPKAPAPAPVVEKPLSGDRPGSPGSPRSETAEQRMAREVNAYKGINV